jgi:hypothetical protein
VIRTLGASSQIAPFLPSAGLVGSRMDVHAVE